MGLLMWGGVLTLPEDVREAAGALGSHNWSEKGRKDPLE